MTTRAPHAMQQIVEQIPHGVSSCPNVLVWTTCPPMAVKILQLAFVAVRVTLASTIIKLEREPRITQANVVSQHAAFYSERHRPEVLLLLHEFRLRVQQALAAHVH